MTTAVLHPSVTALVRDALHDAGADLDGVPVGRRVPHPRPSRFITVLLLGGTRGTEVSDQPTVGIEAWDTDPDRAEDLAQRARYVLHQLAGTVTTGGVVVYRVDDVSSPQDLPHPSGHPRCTFTVQLHVRSV